MPKVSQKSDELSRNPNSDSRVANALLPTPTNIEETSRKFCQREDVLVHFVLYYFTMLSFSRKLITRRPGLRGTHHFVTCSISSDVGSILRSGRAQAIKC